MGYHEGSGGYAAHTSNKEVILAELRAVRQLGVNGLRAGTDFINDMIGRNEGLGKDFTRVKIGGALHTMVPPPLAKAPGAGCPYHPATVADRKASVPGEIADIVAKARELPVVEKWLLTIDEIGAFYSSRRESEHLAACQYCRQAFRDFVKKEGYAPADFGLSDWKALMPAGAYLAAAEAQGYHPPAKKKKGKAAAPAKAQGPEAGDDVKTPEERESARRYRR